MTEVLKPKLDNDLKTEEPPLYAIILHNDGSSHPIMVVHVLVAHLKLCLADAEMTMFMAHTTGVAPCGTYTKDLAETMVAEAMSCDAVMGSELTLTVEPV